MASKTTKALLNRTGARLFAGAQRSFMRRDAVSAERLGERLGLLAYRIDRKHRERALANLAMAFPEWPPERRAEIAREMFRHFGRVAGDFLRAPVRSDEEVLESIEADGEEHIAEAAALGRGTLLITGHIGNWERFAHWLRASGNKLSVVVRDADTSQLNDLILRTRRAAGVGVLSRGNSARAILTKLRQNEMIGILPDQNSDEAFVPFFGKPAGTVLGPGVLHKRTGAAILPSCCSWVGPGRYRVQILPMLCAEELEGEPAQIMAAINLRLEEMIRPRPEQWLWMHDRWKSARRKGLL
jgi:Kdo2-lipid IVA lauroyltransferase/acyltransferase